MSTINITDVPSRKISLVISIQLKAYFYIYLRIIVELPSRLLRELQSGHFYVFSKIYSNRCFVLKQI
jgi:hypothetical protein